MITESPDGVKTGFVAFIMHAEHIRHLAARRNVAHWQAGEYVVPVY